MFGPPNIERMKKRKNVRGLIKALKHEDNKIRLGATGALGEIEDPAAVAPLIQLLKSESPGSRVQKHAVWALGRIGSPALTPLIEALNDENKSVREKAADALGLIKDSRAVQPLFRALEDEYWPVRKATAIALGRIGDEAAVKPLLAALEDEYEAVRDKAKEALDQLGYQPDGTQFASPPDISKLASKADVQGLIEALSYERDPEIRKTAAEALGELADPKAVEPLILLLNEKWSDPNGPHDRSVKALMKIGTPAVKPLIKTLKAARRPSNPMMDPDLNLRVGCVRALGMIADPSSMDVLLQALSDNIPAVRFNAADSLEKIGEPAVSKLIDLIGRMGKRAPVAAADALKGITGQDFQDNAAAWRQWWNENKKI